MSSPIYKVTEVVGTSSQSVTDAIQNAISRTSSTVRNLRWFEVVEVRGEVANAKVTHYQVKMKIGFTLE